MIKKISFAIIVLIICAGGYYYYQSRQVPPFIANYDECVRMGGQVIEGNPSKCVFKDGKVFTKAVDVNSTKTSPQDELAEITGDKSNDCTGIDFKDFSVEETYNGKISRPDFTSLPEANNFRDEIRAGVSGQPNFAGHYFVIELNCGSNCQQHAIVDAISGKILMINPKTSYGISIKPESKLLVANPPENLPDNSDESVESIYYQLSADSQLAEICRQAKKQESKINNNQKLYSDADLGFSLEYPDGVVLGPIATATKDMVLTITKNKISEMEGTLGYNKETATKDMAALQTGKFGENIDWPLEESKSVVKFGEVNAKEFMVLGRFEVCSVLFERKLIFYTNDYQIELTLAGNKEAIVNSMGEYFQVDKTNCGEEKIWSNQSGFYKILKEKNGSIQAQLWYDSFDEIVQSLKITK